MHERGGPIRSGRRSLRPWRLAAAALVVLVCCAGCGDDDPEPLPPPAAEPFFPASFQQTYTHVVECAFSAAHDSSFVEVWVTPNAGTAYVNGAAAMPESSVCVIIMRSGGCAGDVIRYEAMKKGAPGSSPATGDWEWQAVRPDLSVIESGQIDRCSACHATCSAKDYMCGGPLFPPDFLDSYILVRDCRFSSDHNLSRVRVYVDSTGAQSYLNGNYPLPVGTVSVKTMNSGDNEQCEGALEEYAVMVKGPSGTAPSTNDWIWQSVNPDRSVRLSGTIFEGECITCHEDCTKGRDYMCTDP
jgi:hypothetical protein